MRPGIKAVTLVMKLMGMCEYYESKFGGEPEIWDIEEDEDDSNFIKVTLCKKVVRPKEGGTEARKPYLTKRIRIRREYEYI